MPGSARRSPAERRSGCSPGRITACVHVSLPAARPCPARPAGRHAAGRTCRCPRLRRCPPAASRRGGPPARRQPLAPEEVVARRRGRRTRGPCRGRRRCCGPRVRSARARTDCRSATLPVSRDSARRRPARSPAVRRASVRTRVSASSRAHSAAIRCAAPRDATARFDEPPLPRPAARGARDGRDRVVAERAEPDVLGVRGDVSADREPEHRQAGELGAAGRVVVGDEQRRTRDPKCGLGARGPYSTDRAP